MRGIARAALVLVLTAGAGCTDEPRPRFEEPTATPSASDSSSAAAVEKEPWEKKSKAGAVAFAKHWIDVFNQAAIDGDTRSLVALSAPGCGTCRSVAGRLRSMYDSGGFFKGDGYRVLFATPQDITDEGSTSVALRILRSAERLRESADAPLVTTPPSKATYNAQLSWRRGAWAMDELVVFK
jgi:hypothetical protein